MITRIKTIEQHRLSDGGMAIINRLGHSYSFTRTYNSLTRPPDLTQSITRQQAWQLLGDTIRNDVLEVDE